MIDEWTPEWQAENEIYGDIVSINATFHGYATGFAEKLYHWYQHVREHYPKGSIVVKTDDDFYACENLYETGIDQKIFYFSKKNYLDIFYNYFFQKINNKIIKYLNLFI